MAKSKVLKRFRNREGKDLKKLSPEEVAALPILSKGEIYESDDKKWTDYLVAEGFIEPVEESSSPAPKPAPKKRTTRKKASE